MRRDDWKYIDDAWDELEKEEKVVVSPEKQCPNCLHWIDRESLYCSWCGKEQEEEKVRSNP